MGQLDRGEHRVAARLHHAGCVGPFVWIHPDDDHSHPLRGRRRWQATDDTPSSSSYEPVSPLLSQTGCDDDRQSGEHLGVDDAAALARRAFDL